MILVKLGGSVITDKSKLRTFRKASCERLARELSSAKDDLLVVHGAGSFGHIEAKKHELHKGLKKDSQLEHVAAVQRDVRELNLKVIESLIDEGVRAVSVPPAAAATFRNGEITSFEQDVFKRMVSIGLVPVSFGDVVPDDAMGFSICSGDLIMEALARYFKPELVIFCADVDGVYGSDPKCDKNAELIPRFDASSLRALKKTQSKHADVTGSIYGKLERMLAISRHCERCMIVNGNVPGRLGKALRGETVVATVVIPG
jgi:isopentenyl phosphate kinase